MTNLPFDLNISDIERIQKHATETITKEIQDLFGDEGKSLIPHISPALVRHVAGALELVLAEKKEQA